MQVTQTVMPRPSRVNHPIILLLIGVFLMSSCSVLSASVVNLPRTGQAGCYDSDGNPIECTGTGQDGDVLAGVEWPDPRFSDNGDGTMRDNLTGLVWTQDGQVAGDRQFKTWQEALDYVAGMNAGANPNFGHTDWRLPNILELLSLSNHGVPNPANWLVSQGFVNVFGTNSRNFYWSSTTLASHPDKSWIFNVLSDTTFALFKTSVGSVWPVRAGQKDTPDPKYPANVWKTGQTNSIAAKFGWILYNISVIRQLAQWFLWCSSI